MTVDAHYFSPTTPGAASFDVDVSGEIRRGRIGPLPGEAQMAAVGSGGTVLDDIDSTIGHDADGILGLKQFYWNETDCPGGNQRVFTGYTFTRNYARGDSLVQGAARKIDITLMDPNAFLSFRVFAPVADDPTSSFVRPAETTIERIQALLTVVDFLSTTLFDLGYIPTTGGLPMDAHDYTGEKPFDVVNSVAQVSGWNPWVGYDETANELFLWFDDWKTDGSATVPYDSTLKLTNVEAESNDTDTFLIELNGVETVDPSRVIAGVWVMGKGHNVYRTRPETAYTFGWRDAVMQAQYLSDPVKLAALGDRYLLDNSTEDHQITCTVQVPTSLVTAIHEGMRIQLHATHMPSCNIGFTWCRILTRTIRRDVDTEEFYWLDLVLSPIPSIACAEDSIDAYYEDTRTPVMAGSESFAIPAAPSGLPYAIVALGNVESQASLSVGPSVTLDTSGDWVDIGNFSVAPGDYWHEVCRTGYLAQPAGTPETFDLTLTFVQTIGDYTDWAVAAVGVATADTAPVQFASSSGPNADSVTLPGAPTEGNILVLFITVREHADFTIPTGWSVLRTVNHHNSIGSNSWIYVCGTCVPASMDALIQLPAISFTIERHAFVSEWTPA